MPWRGDRLAPVLVAAAWLAALAVACGTTADGPCALIGFAEGVELRWTSARGAVDFEPTRPCARDGRLRVVAAFVDAMPAEGGGFAPRINQEVARDGERLFVWSETRAPVPFRAIPDGTRALTVTLGGTAEPARGFVGTSPSGSAIAYLRWRSAGVTHEVAATLHPVFTEADLVALVRATVAAH